MVTLKGIYHLDVFNVAALFQNTLFPSATLTRTETNWNTHVLENRRALNPCRNILNKIYRLLHIGANFKISKQQDNDLEHFESFKGVL